MANTLRDPSHGQRETRRHYRNRVNTTLTCELVRVQETDLAVYSDGAPVAEVAQQTVIEQRGFLEAYIRRYSQFYTSLVPVAYDATAPFIVRSMIQAAERAGVGPMAAVAGAIAEQVGRTLLQRVGQVVIENGGDIYIHTRQQTIIGLYAGDSPLSMQMGLELDVADMPQGVCTSSGKIGHSLSFGRADAVCVISASCALADAAATAIANRVNSSRDIQSAMAWGQRIEGVQGIVIVVDDKMGAWGKIKLVPL